MGPLGQSKWVKDLTFGHWKPSSELSTMRGRKIHLLGYVKIEKVEWPSPSLTAPQSQSPGLLPGVHVFPVTKTLAWELSQAPQTLCHFPTSAPPKWNPHSCCVWFLPARSTNQDPLPQNKSCHSSSEVLVLFGFFLSIPGLLCACFP